MRVNASYTNIFEDVPLVEFMYLVFTRMRVTVGDSGLCCCTCVTYFERQLTPLCADFVVKSVCAAFSPRPPSVLVSCLLSVTLLWLSTARLRSVRTADRLYIALEQTPCARKVPGEIKRSRDLEEGGGAGPSS